MTFDSPSLVLCGVCANSVSPKAAVTCERCFAMVYCSAQCRARDWISENNDEHSHHHWCEKMKSFMAVEPLVCAFPLTFSSVTASSSCHARNLTQFLTTLGLFDRGLWKYECYFSSSIASWDSLSAPGAGLHQFDALWIVTSFEDDCDLSANSWAIISSSAPFEDAMLRAYVSPIIAILLSLPPVTCTTPADASQQRSLVTVRLSDWAEYYVWRGLTSVQEAPTTVPSKSELSNPAAILLHWPLTIYFILSCLLEKSHVRTICSILMKRTLIIHIIGVEHELSLLPVFKELDYLIRPELFVRLVLVGTCIDPSVNKRVFHLSSRLSVTVWCGLYDGFIVNCKERPDLIIGFNSGLAAYATWVPTLHAIHKLHVPVYFTDACLYSCAWGYRVVARLGLGVDVYEPESGLVLDCIECTGQIAPVLNPFRSPIRMSSAGVQWGWFRNSFIFSPLRISEIYSLEEPSHLSMQLASLKM